MKQSLNVAIVLAALMVVASLGAVGLRPTMQRTEAAPQIGNELPAAFGTWKTQPSLYEQASVEVKSDDDKSFQQPYDQTVMRDYGDGAGHQVMLAVAYTDVQAQEVKTHRPEVCYPAQGYAIAERKPANLTAIPRQPGSKAPMQGIRMLAAARGRLEAVVFWVRTGDSFTDSGLGARMEILRAGLKGHTTDGVLVRASTLIGNVSEAPAAYTHLEGFLHDMVAASPESLRGVLVR